MAIVSPADPRLPLPIPASHSPYSAREAEPGSPSKSSLLTTSESPITLKFIDIRHRLRKSTIGAHGTVEFESPLSGGSNIRGPLTATIGRFGRLFSQNPLLLPDIYCPVLLPTGSF
jgi:hypothetical protein